MSNSIDTLFSAVWFTPGINGRKGLPLLLEGKPGTAKTSRIAQAARRLGFHVEVVIASLREPADFLGLPIPNPDGSVHYAPPSWAVRANQHDHAVVFFDEMNTAAPAVQAALLRCVLEGQVGDLQLNPGIRFVAAQNATEDAAGGYDLSAPLANRFGHFSDMDVSVNDWADWFLSGGGEGEDESKGSAASVLAREAGVAEVWPESFAKAKGLVVGFLKRKNLLLKPPLASDPASSKAWPSPRTWEMATRALAGAMAQGLSETDCNTLVAAFVGLGPATELASYRKEVDLPDPADLLDGKVKWKADERLDRTQAVLSACAALVCPPKSAKRKERATALWGMMEPLAKDHSDLVITAARSLIKSRLNMPELGEAVCGKVYKVLRPVMIEAGLLTVTKP